MLVLSMCRIVLVAFAVAGLAAGCSDRDTGDGDGDADADVELVGAACEPRTIPEGGFREPQVVVDVAVSGCGGGPCVVNHVQGDPDETDPSQPDYIPAAVLEERVLCSCKCGADAAETVTCPSCPVGFECCPLIAGGAPDLQGSYCVRAGTCSGPGVEDPCIDAPPPRSVDLLVEIDNSNSMAQEQANLTQNFEILAEGLLQPTDLDGDGSVDGPLADSLHVGVVSTDMGTGGYTVQTCSDSVDGDDAILRHEPSASVSGCAESYPPFLDPGSDDDPGGLADDFSCIATLGTTGCGMEQQLAAVRKALTVHASGANAGFLREDSLLAILIVTDEEDCSIREDITDATDVFDTELPLGPLNLRCFNHRDAVVEPLDRFVRDLLALRRCPSHLAVTAIAGIPPGSRHDCNLTDMTDGDYQCLLDLPDMQEVIDDSAEGQGMRLTPSCDEPGLGQAFPPRRIVQLIRELGGAGAEGTVRSICEADFRPAMEEILGTLRRALR